MEYADPVVSAARKRFFEKLAQPVWLTPDLPLTVEGMLSFMADGWFIQEHQNKLGLLRGGRREIVPIPPTVDALHIPRSKRKAFRRHEFTVSTDAEFSRVLAHCAKARDAHDGRYIGPRYYRLLQQARSVGNAHSIEIWKNKQLAGGGVFVTVGGLCCSLSLFRRPGELGNDASSAAAFELHARLIRSGFLVHHALIPSPASMALGGRLVEDSEELMGMRIAAIHTRSFSSDPVLMPPKENIERVPESRPTSLRQRAAMRYIYGLEF